MGNHRWTNTQLEYPQGPKKGDFTVVIVLRCFFVRMRSALFVLPAMCVGCVLIRLVLVCLSELRPYTDTCGPYMGYQQAIATYTQHWLHMPTNGVAGTSFFVFKYVLGKVA